jgi:hypothetical protein
LSCTFEPDVGHAFEIASGKYGNIVTTFLPPSRGNG